MTEAKERVELADYSAVGQLLQLEVALLCDAFQCTRTEEHAALERTTGYLFQLVLILGDNSLSVLRSFLNHLHVLLQRVDMSEHQAGEQHRRERARHCQRFVVGLFRQQQRQHVVPALGLQSELAVLVAGDIHVCYVLAELVGQVHGCHTLGAVSRTGEAHEQQRTLSGKQVLSMGHDIRGRYAANVTPQTAHHRTQCIADECGCAGTGQNDIGVGSEELVHECTDLCLCAEQGLQLFAPHSGLLMNLIKGE